MKTMGQKIVPDSSVFTLTQKNFEDFPPKLASIWRSTFANLREWDSTLFPKRLIIELANTCNLDCPMCRVGRYGFNLERVMPLSDFQTLGKEYFGQVEQVRLNGMGEATIIPNFQDYLKEIDNYSCSFEIITNFTSKEIIYQQLIDLNVTTLISWDAADPQLFEILRRRANYTELRNRLIKLGIYAKKTGCNDLLYLIFTLQKRNIQELVPLVDLAAKASIPNIIVNVIKLNNDEWMTIVYDDILRSFREAENRAIEFGVRLFLPDHLNLKRISLKSSVESSAHYCDCPWEEAVIRFNGDVSVCNMFNPFTYGNIHCQPFKNIWNGVFAQTFRYFANTKLRHPYCRGCYYLKGTHDRPK